MTTARVNEAVSDAKVVITEVNMKSLNTGSGLRVRPYLADLSRYLEVLERHRNVGWLGRLRDAMFDTAEDRERDAALRQVINVTYQLNQCLRCRCITCPLIDDRCRCEGCLYGSRVTECPGGDGVETRTFERERGVFMVGGRPAVTAEYDRVTGKTVITVLEPGGLKSRVPFEVRR